MIKSKPGKKKISFSDNMIIDVFIKTQIFGVLIYITNFITFSLLALAFDMPSKFDFICTIICFVLSSLIAGFFVGYKLKQNGLLSGIIFTLPINTLSIIVSLIFSDFSADLNLLITAIVLLISAGAGGIIAVNSRLKR